MDHDRRRRAEERGAGSAAKAERTPAPLGAPQPWCRLDVRRGSGVSARAASPRRPSTQPPRQPGRPAAQPGGQLGGGSAARPDRGRGRARAARRAAAGTRRGSGSGRARAAGSAARRRARERRGRRRRAWCSVAASPKTSAGGPTGRARRIALLGRHVAVGADRPCAAAARPPTVARDAEVDQPRRRAHHHVVGLDVEVHHALAGHVVQRRGDVQRRAAAAARARSAPSRSISSRSVGPSRCSISRCGKRPSVTASKPRTITGMGEARRARRPRGRGRAARPGRVAWSGPQHLGHQHGEPVVVPDEEDLVAPPAAERRSTVRPGAIASPSTSPQVGRSRRSLLPRRRLGDGGEPADRLARRAGSSRSRDRRRPRSRPSPRVAVVVVVGLRAGHAPCRPASRPG